MVRKKIFGLGIMRIIKLNTIELNIINNANLECLINALAALFLLNILYLDKVFYSKEVYDTEYVINKIEI